MDCIFCKIINGDIPSYNVYEDEIVKVFLDVNPDVNGHMLVVPKKHTLDLSSIEDDVLLHIMKVARDMRVLLEDRLSIDGLTLIQNNGGAQQVKHYHLHLKPFYASKQKKLSVEDVYNILK